MIGPWHVEQGIYWDESLGFDDADEDDVGSTRIGKSWGGASSILWYPRGSGCELYGSLIGLDGNGA